MAEEETVHMEGDFVFPNGDTYSGSYLSGPVGIQRDGKGKWSSKKVPIHGHLVFDAVFRWTELGYTIQYSLPDCYEKIKKV